MSVHETEEQYFSLESELSSDGSGEYDSSSEMTESMHKWWLGLDETLKHKLLSLMRIWDFVGIILTYPMKTQDKSTLEEINGVTRFNAKYCRQMKSKSVRNRIDFWLSKMPLSDIQGLIPEDIPRKVTWSKSKSKPMEKETTASATASTSKGKQVPESTAVGNIEVIPKPILELSADLAVQQLMQSLFFLHNISNIRISTRNASETRNVVGKIEAALKDEDTTCFEWTKHLWESYGWIWTDRSTGTRDMA